MRRGSGATAPPPIAIRQALEDGWQGFRKAPVPLILFSLSVGGLNLFCQLGVRWSTEVLLDPFGQPDPLAISIQILAWLGYGITLLWLWVGLLRGAEQSLSNQQPRLETLFRIGHRSLLRAGGTLGLILLVLGLVMRLAQASAWLLALLQPSLIILPWIAGLAACVYLIADQILSLPISVLSGANPLEAFRRSRSVVDPHWVQALGLSVLLGLLILAGFLLLLVGLAATLPLASCTLVAAYRQLCRPPARATRPSLPHQPQRNRD